MSGRRVFEIAVTLRSPFIFQGLDVAGHGFDASAQRDELGRPIIPGDHLRGHLRHALAAMLGSADHAHCIALFGEPSAPGSNDQPAPGALLLGDLRHDGGSPEIGAYHRIALNEKTGAAEEGSLQQIELAAPIGEEVAFGGRLVLRPKAPPDAKRLLETALRMIPALGALKSAGFGEVVPDRCNITPLVDPLGEPVPVDAARYAVTVSFDRPLLVNADRLDNNLFRGATIVPGGAIKGALAAALRDAGDEALLDKAYSNLLIGHAFPLLGGVEGDRALPDVMVAADGQLRFGHRPDVLAELSGLEAPAFPGDWKEETSSKAREMLGRPPFRATRLPRGRVAVTGEGIAKDGALFVVMPVATAGHRWRFILDTTGCPLPLREAVARELVAGLDGLGRTGARMIVEHVGTVSLPVVPPAGRVLLLLETPGALTDLRSDATLFVQYAAYFREVLGADLIACWARQRLAGHYQAIRHRAFGPDAYLPFELTEAGAVFELDVPNTIRLKACLRSGLPPSPFLPSLTWETCPFMAENGYGEISILDPGGTL